MAVLLHFSRQPTRSQLVFCWIWLVKTCIC